MNNIPRGGRLVSTVSIALIITFVLIAGALYVRQTAINTDRNMRMDLLQQTTLVADAIKLKHIAALSGTKADIDLPVYPRIKSQLAATCAAIPDCRFLYLMGQRPDGKIFFFVDSVPAGSEDESPAGQIYEEASDITRRVFTTSRAETDGPVEDRWGTWVSALVPLYDPYTGKILAVLGMDMDAGKWQSKVMNEMSIRIILTLIMVLVVLAAAATLSRKMRSGQRGNTWRHRQIEALLTAAAGLALTCTIAYEFADSESRNKQQFFKSIATAKTSVVADAMRDIHGHQLVGLAGFFEGSEHVTKKEFRAFLAQQDKEATVDAWQWIPAIASNDRLRIEEEARRNGLSEFVIWEKDANGKRIAAPNRNIYYPVFYAEPLKGNENLLGFNIGSDASQRAAIEKALLTGLVEAAPPVKVMRNAQPQHIIFVYQPVFDSAGRKRGVVSAAINAGRLIPQISIEKADARFITSLSLHQVTAGGQSILLGSSLHGQPPRTDEIETEMKSYIKKGSAVIAPVFAYGRTYAVAVRADPDFASIYAMRSGWTTAFAGSLLSAVLAVFVGFLNSRRLTLDLKVRQQTAELRESSERFRKLFEESNISITIRDKVSGEVIDANRRAIEKYGLTSLDELKQMNFGGESPYSLREALQWINKTVSEGPQRFEWMNHKATGEVFWEHVRLSIITLDGTERILCTSTDITERKLAEMALKASEERLHDAYFSEATINMILNESLGDISLEEILRKSLNMIFAVPWIPMQSVGSIYIVDDDSDTLTMKAYASIPEPVKRHCARIPLGECVCGRAAMSQNIEFVTVADDGRAICRGALPPHTQYAVPITSGGKTLGVINLYLGDGHIGTRHEEDFLKSVADALAGIIVRKKAEEKAQHLAYYDALTGLSNRNLFIDRLKQAIARSEYTGKNIALLTLDIDRFKAINDTFGFDAGDAVLKEIARRLLSIVRDGDTVSRFASDDFGVLLIEVAEPADTILITEKIMNMVSRPVLYGGKEILLTLCAGIAIYPADGRDAESLLKNANLAFEKAKDQGRKNYQFYTEEMDKKASEFLMMERDLYQAISNEEFILHYQPYWDINTKKIAGAEALIRWQKPDSGLISPGVFIPVLEETRMIIEVGEWILRTAARQAKEWQNSGRLAVPVSVNLSLIQFKQKNLLQMISRIIQEAGVSPRLLTLEITESAFVQDKDFAYSVLAALREMGISISIDDFGTGYSSLAHLKSFPVDNLKIDMNFIKDLAADSDSASIVSAIISMAHALNLRTIAEGIETEEQWRILRLLRCDLGQGYYFSKPLPAQEVEIFLNQGIHDATAKA